MSVMITEESLDWILTLLTLCYYCCSIVSRDNRCRKIQFRGIKKVCLHYYRGETRLFREKQMVLPHPNSFFPHPPFTRYKHSIEMANLDLFLSDEKRSTKMVLQTILLNITVSS